MQADEYRVSSVTWTEERKRFSAEGKVRNQLTFIVLFGVLSRTPWIFWRLIVVGIHGGLFNLSLAYESVSDCEWQGSIELIDWQLNVIRASSLGNSYMGCKWFNDSQFPS